MDWSPDFCLACDKQTDGRVYCSEVCRLAEYEKASSNPSSAASSPKSPVGISSWPYSSLNNSFFMEPARNVSKAPCSESKPVSRTPSFYAIQPARSTPMVSSNSTLSPSSSHASLLSIQSNLRLPPSEPSQLSHESRKALRAYASCFDQSRNSRRQSSTR